MKRVHTLQRIEKSGIVAILRAPASESMVDVAESLRTGGIDIMEITADTPGSFSAVERLRNTFDDMTFGIGTVLDPETARRAVDAGAQFLVSPALNGQTIVTAHRYDCLMIPGVYTPTEVAAATEAGALSVKVFPASTLGPDYIRQMRGPFPRVLFIPTGGVTLDNAGDYIRAGATAVGLGSGLVRWDDVNFRDISKNARAFRRVVDEARGEACASFYT